MPQETLPEDLSTETAPAADDILLANQTQNEFSGYHQALGEAGYKDPVSDNAPMGPPSFLGRAGEGVAITAPAGGFTDIYVGCSWERITRAPQGFFSRLLRFSPKQKVDLDLGCLCEMMDGSRVALQALGEAHGAHEAPPYVSLSPDERTGMTPGDDEFFKINGAMWPKIKRLLIYVYIYQGARTWAEIGPKIHVEISGQPSVMITPHTAHNALPVCALVLMENSRDGIKITNLTEYFGGQAEMDRAYGFGFLWGDGTK